MDSLKEPERVYAAHGDGEEQAKKSKKKKKTEREVGDDENWVQPKLRDNSEWIAQYDECYPDKILVASAKTIGRMLCEEEIDFLYYFGDLSKDQKNAAIADFEDKPNIKVLVSQATADIKTHNQSLTKTTQIASIHCGGKP